MNNRISRRTLLTLGAAALPVGLASAQSSAAPAERLSALLRESGVPGMSVAVVRDGALAWTRAWGIGSKATGAPVTEHTVFQAASLTKPVFAWVVLNLCAEGKLSLDTPLREYIPANALSAGGRANQITPRLLLAHSSGLPAFRPSRGRLTPKWAPGTAFSYSGAGYELLQDAVEQVTGQALETYAATTLFAPLGMRESSLIWRAEHETSAAAGHDWDGSLVREVSRPERANAAGSLHTTPADFARLMVEMMSRNGALDYVFKRMALSPQVRLRHGLAWGLGWGLGFGGPEDCFWHFGDSRGYMTHAIGFPAQRSAVVVFTNGRHGLRLAEKAADEVLGEPSMRSSQADVFRWILDVFYEGKLPQ